MIDREQALEIIDKHDFFNDRAGRELWNDKPKEIQDEDIRNAHEDYVALREYVLNQPKVGEWIPVDERLPEIDRCVLVSYKSTMTWDKKIYADQIAIIREDGWHWWDELETKVENEIVAWRPLPEPPKGETE